MGPEDDLENTSSTRTRLPVLAQDGNNFTLWHPQLKSYITGAGKLRYIDGRAIEPAMPTAPSAGADAPDTAKHNRELTKYNKDKDEPTKSEFFVLDRLLYENQGDLYAQAFVDRMHQLKCDENERDPRPKLDELDRLIADYARAGGTLADTEKKNIVLHLMPQSWAQNVRNILSNAETARQMALVMNPSMPAPIFTADMLIHAIRSLATTESALNPTAPASVGAALVAGPNDICDNCGKKGHFRRDCWCKGGGKAGQRPANWREITSRPSGNSSGGRGRNVGRRGKNNNKSSNGGGNSSGSNNNETHFAYAFHATTDVATDFAELEKSGIVVRGFTALIDSGANNHYCSTRDRFIDLRDIDPIPICSADNRTFYAKARSNVPITVLHHGRHVEMLLTDVLYAPEMPLTLISVSRMTKAKFAVHFEQDGAHVLDPNRRIAFLVQERNGLYPVLEVHASKTPTPKPTLPTGTAFATMSLHELHCRMGHADIRALSSMVKRGLVTGIKLTGDEAGFCKGCAMGQLKHEPFPAHRSSPQAKNYGGRVHSDIWGPAPTESLGRCHYFVVFVDDHSDEVIVTGLRAKSEALEAYRHFEAWTKVHHGTAAIGEWQTDGAGEFTSKEAEKHLKEKGTHHRITVHDSSSQNGKAEPYPRFLWLEAVSQAAWLRNRTETEKSQGSTPHTRATGKIPDLSQVRRFGANVWVKLEGASKIDIQAKPCRWVGIDAHAKGHRIYWPELRKISIERNVRFEGEPDETIFPTSIQIEGEMGGKSAPDAPKSPVKTPAPVDTSNKSATSKTSPKTPDAPSAPDPEPSNSPSHRASPPFTPPSPLTSLPPSEGVPDTLSPEPEGHSWRTRKPSKWLQDIASGKGDTGGRGAAKVPDSVLPDIPSAKAAIAYDGDWLDGAVAMAIRAAFAGDEAPLAAFATMDGDSPTVREALKGDEREMWEKSMKEEITKLEQRRTWELRDEDNNGKSYKSRLVAGGHRQLFNVDFTETAAPTMTLATFRFLLALAAKHDLEAENIDFSSAYINADLEETVYMRQPPGFERSRQEDRVCLLRKAIYGLKQAGRQWYRTVRKLMEDDLGFTRCAADPAVFYLFEGGIGLIVGIHVDDSLILSNSAAACQALKREIGARFDITDLGPVRWLLGFEIRRDRAARRLTISQSVYIDTLAERFGMQDARPLSVPLDPHANLFDDHASDGPIDNEPYAPLTGSLMYAAIGTRFDIAFPTSTLARFMSNPRRIHWEAGKRVLRYLIGTKDKVLTLGLDDSGLTAYSDVDHASQPDRHSVSGNVFLYDSAAISWSSRKQAPIALSSTEAEYIAAASAAREIVWLCALVSELGDLSPSPTSLRCDNQSAIALANNGLMNSRTKHIDIRYRYVHEAIENGLLALSYVPTNDQAADLFTKALPRAKVEYFSHLLGLRTA
ncbi:Transcription factor [Mycena venus]|uniref:Transcription factor n=1 Tax=Mycena venus TaxID=2733690 RepID=A0A8H6TW74_9AGAR|nr:Transcription factor [Mycena venus]